MVRIPLPTPDQLTAEQRRVYEAIGGLRGGHVPLIYQAAMHSPELTDKWQQLGELLRYRTSLPARLSELGVLVVARDHDCQYAWHAHEPVALKAGIEKATVEAIKAGRRPEFAKADEEAVYAYSKELLESKFVSAPVYERALEAIGVKGVVELTALLGYYVMVAMALNAHELPLPAGVQPPLGLLTR